MLDDITVREVLELAVKTEELGELFYKRLAERFKDDPEVSRIFSLLAEDEVHHHQQFRRLLETVPQDLDVPHRDERLAVLNVIARAEFFAGQSTLLRTLETIKTPQDALERAFQLEKDTWVYYLAMKELLGDNEALLAIIEVEKGHMTQLAKHLVTGDKFRGLGDHYRGGHAK